VLIGTEIAGLYTTQRNLGHRPSAARRCGESTIDGNAHFSASPEAILSAVTFAVVVALMWITLAVITVGLVNVAKGMVPTSTRHPVADGRHDDTQPTRRPVMQLQPTTRQR
jgi:hypothetical protein